MLAVTNSTFAVDTFFCIGGLLTSYLMLKHLKKNGGRMNVALMYLHRYIRCVRVTAFVRVCLFA